MEYFERIGSFAADLWKKHNNNERHFPEVAATVLAKMPPHKNTTFEEVTRYALVAESLPHQADLGAEFGQPPLTIYLGRDFRIEILYWTGATPAIHQHAFSGAFHVMHGSSIHIAWDFDFDERISSHFHYGRVGLRKAELLKQGDTRLIHAGKEFIHTTFHLDNPTVSIVVRTTNEQDQSPQYSYLPPSICYNARDNMPLLKRKCQMLAMLVNAGRPEEHDEMFRQLLPVSDAFSVFHYLYQANLLRDKSAFEKLLSDAQVPHDKLVAQITPAMAYLRRQTEITKLRNKITDPDLRFFLALLINIGQRDAVLSLLKDRYPQDDPVTKLTEFVRQLSEADLLGETFTDPWLLMLDSLLRGAKNQDQVEQAFARKYGDVQVRNQRTKITNLATSVRRFWLFHPLLEYQAGSEPATHNARVNERFHAPQAGAITA